MPKIEPNCPKVKGLLFFPSSDVYFSLIDVAVDGELKIFSARLKSVQKYSKPVLFHVFVTTFWACIELLKLHAWQTKIIFRIGCKMMDLQVWVIFCWWSEFNERLLPEILVALESSLLLQEEKWSPKLQCAHKVFHLPAKDYRVVIERLLPSRLTSALFLGRQRNWAYLYGLTFYR